MAYAYNYEIGASFTPTGTVSIAGTTAVTGSGTSFTTQFASGYLIQVGGVWRVVDVVTTNTAMTVTAAWGATLSGQTFAGVALKNVESLVAYMPAPKGDWVQFSKREDLADGSVRGYGVPAATWKWGFLTQAQRNALRAYSPYASSAIYIRTKTMDNSDAYAYYNGFMVYPEKEDRQAGKRLEFTVEFRWLNLLTVS